MSDSLAPSVAIAQIFSSARVDAKHWQVAWKIENRGDAPLTIHSAWLPHSQFRAPEKQFGNLEIAPRARTQIGFVVEFAAPRATEIENAFLIMRVNYRGAAWKIFARVRVHIEQNRAPRATTELITVQKTEGR
ncbi:MAG: hypothetical protein HY257_03315 [Chloroflexi bacterium]|nr:hypothetical protein [Chloroflexota bacterium]